MTSEHSLADAIRGLGADELGVLLRRRPDLTNPAPTDLDELIERASGQASTRLALQSLDAWTLQAAQAMAASELGGGEAGVAELAAGLGMAAHADQVRGAVERLAALALVWGDPPQLTQAARSAFGNHPAGLAGPSPNPLDAPAIAQALTAVGPAGRELLDRLLWGPPTGAVQRADRPVTVDDAESTIDLLLAHRLLRPIGPDQVILPREVALHLRGGVLIRDPAPAQVPDWPTTSDQLGASLPIELVDQAAIGSGQELVSHVTAILDDLGTRMPHRLSTGGIPKKEMTALSRLVGGDFVAGLAVALAQTSGMLVEQGPRLAATERYDAFLDLDGFHRWLSLRRAWLGLQWWPEPSDTRRSALLRAAMHTELRTAQPGTPVDPPTLAARLAWRHPSWSQVSWTQSADQLHHEAELLGLIAFGRTTALASISADAPDPGFAPFGDTLILQSDLSAVAPAPLDHDTEQTAAMIAVRESHGATATFRFTPTSIRAGLDAGWSPEAMIEWLHEHDAAGLEASLPHPLVSLVNDISRRHGQLRVMAVSAVIQVDDEVTAASLLADSAAAELGLTTLAPGVISSTAEPEEVVAYLHQRGLSPLAQDAQGTVFTTPPVHRAPAPALTRATPPVDPDRLAASLLRRQGRGMAPADVLQVLTDAHREDRWVMLDWADDDGALRSAKVRVLTVGSGIAHLVRRGAGRLNLPLARIVAVDDDAPSTGPR